MARLASELLDRGRQFSHRMVDVAEALDRSSAVGFRLKGRIVDQLVGAGTSVGANLTEADEALSRLDFCRALGIVLRELRESRFWLEFVGERDWIRSKRLSAITTEGEEFSRIFSVTVARTKRIDRARKQEKSKS